MNRIIYLTALLFLVTGCISIDPTTAFSPTPIPAVDSNPEDYFDVQDKITTQYRYVNSNELRFTYRENYENNSLDYKIYNQQREVVQSSAHRGIAVAYGLNKIALPLEECPYEVTVVSAGAGSIWFDGVSSGLYVLEITDKKGRKKYLTFLKTDTRSRFHPCPMRAATGQGTPGPVSTF